MFIANRSQVRVSALAAAAVMAAAAGSAFAQASIEFLGTLPGVTPISQGFGVSDDGSTVTGLSGSSFYYGSSSHGYKWSRSGGMEDLDALASISAGWAISGDGQSIVGQESSTGSTHAYRWINGVSDQLYHGGGSIAISRDGTVVGGYSFISRNNSGHRATIVDTSHSHMQNIDDQNTMTTSETDGVSADGTVAVGWTTYNALGRRAFKWDAVNGMQNIGSTVPGGPTSEALGVSHDGSIIVGDSANPGQYAQAKIWSAAGTPDLGALIGAPYSVAYAISSDGSTVVGTKSTNPLINGQGWIWRADIGVQSVQTALGAVLPAGWTIINARGVSGNGQFVTGSAINPAGHVEAWLATMPACIEPSVTAQPSSQTVVVGTSATLSTVAAGYGPFAYQWTRNGTPVAGATSATLTVAALTSADAASYQCNITSPCGTTTSNAASLTITGLCTADFDNNGFLTGEDFDAYVAAFEVGTISADFDGDGFVTGDDFDAFVAAFEAGC